MLALKPWPLLAIILSCEALNQESGYGIGFKSGHQCTYRVYKCKTIHDELPSIVHLPDAPEYKARHSTYYSLQQQELFPPCTVEPTSVQGVSRALQIAEAGHCRFAVASGGHMAWKGSSNLDDGFVLDLRRLNKIDISPHDQIVRLGPGSPWTNVYAALSRYNLTAAGARINSVGVGGFLLGGGISFLSQTQGFSADTVCNYEVVLANGSVVNANNSSHPDLFWALKLASTNYGVVTRFDMRTFTSPATWGAVSLFPVTNQSLSEVFADYEAYAHDNNNPNVFKSAVMVNSANKGMIMTVIVNTDGDPEPPMTSVDPIQHTEEIGTTRDVVNNVIAAVLEPTARAAWFTLTTKVDTQLFLDINELARKVFKPFMNRGGVSIVVSSQAFQTSFIEATRGTPIYNSMSKPGEDLTLVLFLNTWTDPVDDEVLKEATHRLGTLAEDEARERGMLADFIYMNYANGEQPVYERAVSPEDLDRMLRVRDTYDPKKTFQKLWKGGYKLPGNHGHHTWKRDEL